MANASFTAFRDALMNGNINLNTGVIKVAIVKGYTYNAAHTYMSDATAAGAITNGTPVALANKTITGGVFDADDTTITTTADGANHTILAYQSSAPTGGADLAANAQRLCWFFDTGTGLPVVPGTGTVTITWPSTSAKIYKIG